MKRRCLALAAVVALGTWACAKDDRPPAQTQPASTAPAPGQLEFPHLHVDLVQRRVVLDAETCRPDYLLEFLLCRQDTKEYESVVRTAARGADLHAALLALGLTPGKPARWSSAVAPATFLPPAGPELTVQFQWTDQAGAHQVDAGDWLDSPQAKGKAPPRKWVFIGSEVLPDGPYWADLPSEGGIISVANVASAVIDVPFESSSTMEQRDYVPNRQAMPPPGTAVKMIITPLPGAERAPDARVWLEIDRFGRLRLEGQLVELDQLEPWGRTYIAAHARGQVVIRCQAEAIIEDLREAREALDFAGVRDLVNVFMPPEDPLLPRTPGQARADLEHWRQRLANPQDYIADPADQIRHVLRQVELRMREMEALAAMWAGYAKDLQESLKAAAAATQPAERSN